MKPCDPVLVRDSEYAEWELDIFGYEAVNKRWAFHCVGGMWKYCIPYVGNEELLGKC